MVRTDDLLGMVLGNVVSNGGTHRRVWECALLPGYVVKIERTESRLTTPRRFANIDEWQLWDEMRETSWSKWLAPCHSISENGLILIQRHCKPLAGSPPSRVPSFLADLKPDNWGMLAGRPVCFDYANNRVLANQRNNVVLVRGKWHDGKGNSLDKILPVRKVAKRKKRVVRVKELQLGFVK